MMFSNCFCCTQEKVTQFYFVLIFFLKASLAVYDLGNPCFSLFSFSFFYNIQGSPSKRMVFIKLLFILNLLRRVSVKVGKGFLLFPFCIQIGKISENYWRVVRSEKRRILPFSKPRLDRRRAFGVFWFNHFFVVLFTGSLEKM